MVVKGEKNLFDYKYLVTFDLASRNTGVCLWNIQEQKPEKVSMIRIEKKDGSYVYDLYKQVGEYFRKLEEEGVDLNEIFVSKEAMPVQLRGGSSTVQTFIALAKSHAVLDLYLVQHDIDVYDYTGIYPITTHAYLKKVLGLENKAPIDKKDIQDYMLVNYGLKTETFDESDAAFLAVTLINSKWNKDIMELIKEVKRHKKELKLQKAIESCNEKIKQLENNLLSS